MQNFILSLLLLLLNSSAPSIAWTPTIEPTKSSPPQPKLQQQQQSHNDKSPIWSTSMTSSTTRRSFLPVIVATMTSTTAIILNRNGNNNNNVAMAAVIPDTKTNDETAAPPDSSSKKLNLSDDELIQIIRDDIVQRQFLVTGNITKSIYAANATFTDEIDTYQMDQWMIGTQRLFVGDKSQVRLVNNHQIILTSPTTIEFAFDEDLMFNLPIIKPIVSLTGKVVLTRDPNTGYITSYREYWDQDVATVLKTAKF